MKGKQKVNELPSMFLFYLIDKRTLIYSITIKIPCGQRKIENGLIKKILVQLIVEEELRKKQKIDIAYEDEPMIKECLVEVKYYVGQSVDKIFF
jgi:hypothetical protein